VGFYWVGIVVRIACELYLAAVIVRDLVLPHHDPAGERPEDPVVEVRGRSRPSLETTVG